MNITADTAYILTVNGEFVSRGPAKSQTFRYYDTVDISSYLRTGNNVLIVQVCHYVGDPYKANCFKAGPVAMTAKPQGGLLIFGDQDWKSDGSYMCHEMKAYRFAEAPEEYQYMAYTEELDAGKLPGGLDGSESDDWVFVKEIETNVEYFFGGLSSVWKVAPRPIPRPFEKNQPFMGVVRTASGFDDAAEMLRESGVTIPAGTDTWVELDAGENITAFPVFEMEGDAGNRVEFLYAECYGVYENGVFVKRDRTDHRSPGQQLAGITDVYITGKRRQQYQPFDYKAFRFLRVRIQTGDMPLWIRTTGVLRTGYPLPVTTRFSNMSETDQAIWDVSYRTVQNCMYDTFMDCPHYERMQYLMDTCLQIQFSCAISNDDRLIRKAIIDMGDAQRVDGLIPCNVPSNIQQIIPGFALYYIFMLKQYYYNFGKKDLLRKYFPAVERILWFFEQHLNEQMLVYNTGYWQFIDWAKDWDHGVPLRYAEEPNGILTMMYVYALREATDISRILGYRDIARRNEKLADRISAAVNHLLFDEEFNLYKDTTERDDKSQHAQIWAVLAGIAKGEKAWNVMNACLSEQSLTKVSFCMEYYLLRALEKVGEYHRSRERWALWQGLLAQNVTTWPEDPVTCRSECHAWSAVPLYEYTACGLGLTPAAPGFSKLRVSPKMFWLKHFGGEIQTPAGRVAIEWEINDDVFTVTLTTENPTAVLWDLPGFSGEELVENTVQRRFPLTKLIQLVS